MARAPRPRTLRELGIDVAVIIAAILMTLAPILSQGATVQLYPQPFGGSRALPFLPSPLDVLASPLGQELLILAGCLMLWWRRRRPLRTAASLLVLGVFAPVAVPVIAALFTVAAELPPRRALWCAAAGTAPLVVFLFLPGPASYTEYATAMLGCTLLLGAVGWGFYVRSRRELVASFRERAERAETEAALRAERARRQARAEVAREMHDVLGHRLSLLSVHAGALEFNPGAPPPEVARASGVIRENAHQALEELRTVLAVLRDPDPDPAAPTAAPSGPAPRSPAAAGPVAAGAARPLSTLADLDRLVEEARAGGTEVTVGTGRAGGRAATSSAVFATLPAVTGRAAFRMVQEGLTNARKHAPGAPVRVDVEGAPGEGLRLEVHNGPPSPSGSEDREHAGSGAAGGATGSGGDDGPRHGAGRPEAVAIPGAGQGLIGLTERVSLAGGHLSYARDDDGFRLTARLPWPA